MAASIYATPPPDLSSEDTALSDASNSSQISNLSSQHSSSKHAASAATAVGGDEVGEGRTGSYDGGGSKKHHKRNITNVLMGHNQALMARSLTSSSNSALLEAMQFDQSKKRRKQSTPIRLAALNLSANGGTKADEQTAEMLNQSGDDDEHEQEHEHDNGNGNVKEEPAPEDDNQNEDFEDKLSKIFLPKLVGQLNPFELLHRNISPLENFQEHRKARSPEGGENERQENQENLSNYSQIFCKECGENFDSDLRLRVHILQEHSVHQHQDNNKTSTPDERNAMSMLSTVKVKLEQTDNEERISPVQDGRMMPKPDQWLSAMPNLGFPFPPEAAAAAFSSGYLSQLPLLGVPPTFPSVEGLTRPPLRIFNPEAYCDLCNKEFCNKYFLKTHKANKHGIYDPACTSTESGITSAPPMGTMTQVFHLQLQQQQQMEQQQAQFQAAQHQHQQQQQQRQQQEQQQQVAPPVPMVPCDVCSKKFTNIFAMKRHRTKAHEVPPPTVNNSVNSTTNTTSAANISPNEIKYDTESTLLGHLNENDIMSEKDTSASSSNNIRFPEGFREDFSVEQEDVSFTPQPRKLSPSSQQQARDSNFSFDKLKRLGVINPEAFCDICCKEYCNKYFLRTHKWKRHGVFVPPDDAKDDVKMQWPFFAMQTTPLNLMMANEKLMERKALASIQEAKDSAKRLKFDSDANVMNGQCEKSDDHTAPVESPEAARQVNDPETVGLNLQKLQSMIMQLNDLNGKRPIPCHICGKEMENQYVLHAHVATEHSVDNNNGNSISLTPFVGIKLSPSSSPVVPTIASNEACKQCDREFTTIFDLKQHIAEAHTLPSLSNNSPLREGFVTPERPVNTNSGGPTTPGGGGNQSERARAPYTITPTSSYCEICNKELCNKYFMKTHMQRMHGIEIENGAQIGGVVCNICNKELCSKYFLRVHKHNTHGIVDESSPLPQSRQSNGTEPQEQPDITSNSFANDSKVDLAGVDFNTRYFTHYTEVCPLCSRRFRSAKWLRAHLMSDHGPAGIDKLREMEQQLGGSFSKPSSPTLKIPNGNAIPQQSPLNNINPNLLVKNPFPGLFNAENPIQSPRFKEYQCSLCSFSTPYYAFLFIHERSHSILSGTSSVPTPTAQPISSPAPIKSESAVSIAKEIANEVCTKTQSTSTTIKTAVSSSSSSSSTSSGGTPTTTPASTPVPQTPQETAKRDSPEGAERSQATSVPASTSATTASITTTSTTTTASSTSLSISSLSLPSSFNIDVNILQEVANKSNRPVAYAVPQDFNPNGAVVAGNELMQSFFVQENPSLEGINGSNRFVPALIYLPVRERISGPITVSFTLTPA